MLSHKSIKNHLNEPTNDHRRISGRNKLVTVSLLLFVGPERNILRAKEPYRFSYPPYFAVQYRFLPFIDTSKNIHSFPLYTHTHTLPLPFCYNTTFFFFFCPPSPHYELQSYCRMPPVSLLFLRRSPRPLISPTFVALEHLPLCRAVGVAYVLPVSFPGTLRVNEF